MRIDPDVRINCMKAFNVSVFLWRICMSEHLIQMILRKEVLDKLGHKLRSVIIPDFYCQTLSQDVHRLENIHNHKLPGSLDFVTSDMVAFIPIEDCPCECVDDREDVCVL